MTVSTIGHSTHPIGKFIEILRAHGIEQLVDIRTIPRSRHNPQYDREALAGELEGGAIGYCHLAELGGLRRPRADSPNTGWRNLSFRGFADYMQTAEFATGIDTLMRLAGARPTAIMCAEAVPWRCHRSLVADALLVRGVTVQHIQTATKASPHNLTSFAHVQGTGIVYGEPLLDLSPAHS